MSESTKEWERRCADSLRAAERKRRQERAYRGTFFVLLIVLVGAWFAIALAVNAIANWIGGI